jgi:hypothetical protein
MEIQDTRPLTTSVRAGGSISNPCPQTNPTDPGVWRAEGSSYIVIADLIAQPGSSLCLLQLSLSLCKCRLAKQSHTFCNLPEFVPRRLVICFDHMSCSSSRMLHAGSPPRTGTHETPHDGQEWPLFHLPGRASSIQDLFSECKAFTWPFRN